MQRSMPTGCLPQQTPTTLSAAATQACSLWSSSLPAKACSKWKQSQESDMGPSLVSQHLLLAGCLHSGQRSHKGQFPALMWHHNAALQCCIPSSAQRLPGPLHIFTTRKKKWPELPHHCWVSVFVKFLGTRVSMASQPQLLFLLLQSSFSVMNTMVPSHSQCLPDRAKGAVSPQGVLLGHPASAGLPWRGQACASVSLSVRDRKQC